MLKKEYLKNKSTCKVTFTLPTEAIQGVSEVQLLGDFNNWNIAQGTKMKNSKTGFEATLELAAGRYYEFRYLLDGNIWTNDPAADAYHATPFGAHNSVVKVEEVIETKAPIAKATTKTAAPKAATTKTTAVKAPVAKTTTAKTAAPKATAAAKAPVAKAAAKTTETKAPAAKPVAAKKAATPKKK